MLTSEKQEKLTKQVRVLWPKYDPDLDTQVNGRPLIKEYVKEVFTKSKLDAEYVQLRSKKNIDDLIDAEAAKMQKTKTTSKNRNDVSLNQAGIINVIENLYDIPETETKPKSKKTDQAKPSSPKKKTAPVTAPAAAPGDYADYYARIKEMAKDKRMKEEDVLPLLKDRQKGENAYQNVSEH